MITEALVLYVMTHRQGAREALSKRLRGARESISKALLKPSREVKVTPNSWRKEPYDV